MADGPEARATAATDPTSPAADAEAKAGASGEGAEQAQQPKASKLTDTEARLVKDIGKLKERLRRLKAERESLAQKAEAAERQAGDAEEARSLAAEATQLTEQAAQELAVLREQLNAAQASIQAAFDATVSRLPEREQALWKEMPGSVAEKFALLAKHRGIIASPGGDVAGGNPPPAPPANTGTASGSVRVDQEVQALLDRAQAGDRQAARRAEQLIWSRLKLPMPGQLTRG